MRRGAGRHRLNEAFRTSVETLITDGVYDPGKTDTVTAYDQLSGAIDVSVGLGDETELWHIALGAGPLQCPDLERRAATEAVLLHYRFATEDLEKPEIYWYDKPAGIYRKNGAARISTLVKLKMPGSAHSLESEIIAGVRARTYRSHDDFQPPENLVCVRNGVLDLDSMTMSPHSPDVIFLSRVNAKFDPGVDCPAFNQFLKEVLNPCDILVIEEWFGYLLRRTYFIHAILFLLGAGCNGKGTLLKVFGAFLGKGNYSATNIHNLGMNVHATADVYGMLANFDADVSNLPLVSTGVVKKLSGGDEVPCNRKHKSPFPFVSYAKLICAGNIPPKSPDNTPGFWSRWVLIEFPNSFHRADPKTDANIIGRLTTEKELSGILNLALKGLSRLEAAGDFSYTKSLGEVRALWERCSNSVHSFVEAHCKFDPKAECTKSDAYSSYVGFCARSNFVPLDDNVFAKELMKEMPLISTARPTVHGSRVPMWRGLVLS
jgi:P4 family phage/plasmid primase-like protien